MKKILTILLLGLSLLLVGCSQTIQEVKTEEMVGKQVTISGDVTGSVKILSFTGYEVKDKNGDKIGVIGGQAPNEGDSVKVTGELKKGALLGYYIQVPDEKSE